MVALRKLSSHKIIGVVDVLERPYWRKLAMRTVTAELVRDSTLCLALARARAVRIRQR